MASERRCGMSKGEEDSPAVAANRLNITRSVDSDLESEIDQSDIFNMKTAHHKLDSRRAKRSLMLERERSKNNCLHSRH